MTDKPSLRHAFGPAFAAGSLILPTLGIAAWLHALDPERFYHSLREDEYVEWATFWADRKFKSPFWVREATSCQVEER
jgi:hypothetical protein